MADKRKCESGLKESDSPAGGQSEVSISDPIPTGGVFKNDENSFLHLNLKALVNYAERWADTSSLIESIALYHGKLGVSPQYVLVLEVPGVDSFGWRKDDELRKIVEAWQPDSLKRHIDSGFSEVFKDGKVRKDKAGKNPEADKDKTSE